MRRCAVPTMLQESVLRARAAAHEGRHDPADRAREPALHALVGGLPRGRRAADRESGRRARRAGTAAGGCWRAARSTWRSSRSRRAFGIAQAAVDEAWTYAQERASSGADQRAPGGAAHARGGAHASSRRAVAMLYHAAWLAQHEPAVQRRDVDGEAVRRPTPRSRSRSRASA